MTRTGRTYWYC